MRRALSLLLLLSLCCAKRETAAPARGPELLARYGCNVCHIIPGIAGPQGRLGPDLTHVGSRARISEETVPNTLDGMTRFIVNPAAVNPETSMPTVGVSEPEARGMARYLATLR